MKRNAIARIIIYSIVVVLLIGLLVAGLGMDDLSFSLDFDNANYFEGTGSVRADQIKNIRIEWSSGDIDLSVTDEAEITFTEEGYGNEKMLYQIKDDTLVILYSKPTISFGISRKNLTVTIPKSWAGKNIILDVASADISAQDLMSDSIFVSKASGKSEFNNCIFNEMEMETASGDCSFVACDIGKLDAQSASGKIRYEGKLNTLDCELASGDFVGVFKNVPDELNVDSASGNMDITFPAEHSGFQVEMDASSGRFHSDYPTSLYNGSYTYGDAHCKIEFDAASGDIFIRKP